ncbi:MAG: hypothetical protein HYX75_02075 [Acidobacteria bacterium]|nr:hypothetical protein [Acidobacteriota bacterium]
MFRLKGMHRIHSGTQVAALLLFGSVSMSMGAQIGVNYDFNLCWPNPCVGQWKSLANNVKDNAGSPAVAPCVIDNTLLAVYRDSSGWMRYQQTWDGMTWNGPNAMGRQFLSDPAASTWGISSTAVAGIGMDGHMYLTRFLDGQFVGWQDLGGYFGPAQSGSYFRPVVVDASSWFRGSLETKLYVFGMEGSTGCLWVNVAKDGYFGGWKPLRCGCARDGNSSLGQNRFAAFERSGEIHVFVRMQDSSLGHLTGGDSGWAFESCGGVISSGPGAAGSSNGYAATAYVVDGVGKNLWVWERTRAKTGWTMLDAGKLDPPSIGSTGDYLKVFAHRALGGVNQYYSDGLTPWTAGWTLEMPAVRSTSEPAVYLSDDVPQPLYRGVFLTFQ